MSGLLDFLQSASNSVASNVTAPVDGIAWLLRKAGIPVPDAPVGGSDWAQNAGLTRPVQQSGASLAGESLGMIAPMLIAAKAPQVARGLLQAGENAMVPQVLRKESGMFIGPSAKTWDAEAASRAQQLAAKGADPRAIWSDTGTWKGPDGAWRQEIPDNMAALRTPSDMSALAQSYKARQLEIKDLIAQSKLHPDLFPKDLAAAQKLARAESASYKTPLTEYYGLNSPGPSGSKAKYAYNHDPLHRAYPDIGEEVVIRQGKDDGDFFGSYVNNQLDVNRSASTRPGGANSTTAHEMQHAIQGREGWAGGGNPGQFRSGGQLTPFEQYQRLAGEAEARATQARIPLDAAQRRALFPEDSYDVPIDQLIVRRDGTGSAASMPFTYPQDKALATAQRNAALPIEQGGLGLGPENTAMERARALGFDTEGVHTSRHGVDVKELDSGKYAMAPFDAIGTHFGTKEAALDRFNRTVGTTEQFKGSTYPVMLDGSKPLMNKQGAIFNEEPLLMSLSEKADYGNLPVSNAAQREQIFSKNSIIPYINDVEGPGSISYIAPPKSIRSRFAAFDPMRRNEADLLGRADPELLGLLSAGLLGYGGYNALSKP